MDENGASCSTRDDRRSRLTRRRWRAGVLAAVLAGAAGLTACAPAPPRQCAPVAFESAEVVLDPAPTLVVTATVPPPYDSLLIDPVQYVQRPEYWQINVIGCGPTRATPGQQPTQFIKDRVISDAVGTKGIAVTGAGSQRQQIDVRWDPPPTTTTSTRPPEPGFVGLRGVRLVAGPAGNLVSLASLASTSFKADGTVEVRACHVSVGHWQGEGTALSISDMTVGARRDCTGSSEADEASILRALDRVTSWRLVKALQDHSWYPVYIDNLVLSDADGRVVLTAAPYTR